jgi:hypothetical protein
LLEAKLPAVAADTHAQQQQQQELPELKLDLRSEYFNGSSSFVAPAKQQQQQQQQQGSGAAGNTPQCSTPCSATAARSECASAFATGPIFGFSMGDGSSSSSSGSSSCSPGMAVAGASARCATATANPSAAVDLEFSEPAWRRSSTDGLLFGSAAAAATARPAAATRSSSSSSLAMSITDDAEIEESRIGSYGAIGQYITGVTAQYPVTGLPSTPPSSSCNISRAVPYRSPAAAAGVSSSSIWGVAGGLPTAATKSTGTAGACSLGTSPLAASYGTSYSTSYQTSLGVLSGSFGRPSSMPTAAAAGGGWMQSRVGCAAADSDTAAAAASRVVRSSKACVDDVAALLPDQL